MSRQIDRNLPIIPENWTDLWSPQAVRFLTPFIKNLQFAMMERDHEVFLQLWEPGANPRGSFISCGVRKRGVQKNGNKYSVLFAFGFFYEAAFCWPEDFMEYWADCVVDKYAEFLAGQWPIDNIADDEVLKRNANVSAPSARRTDAHKGNAAIKAISPTRQGLCDVKKLNTQMEAAVKTAVKTDMWGEPITEEVDPLS